MSDFRFYIGYAPNSTSSAVYEVLTGYEVLTDINLINNAGYTVTVAIYIVPTGETLGNEHKLCFVSLDPGDSGLDALQKGLLLVEGDEIYIEADAASVVSVVLSGVKYDMINNP